MELVPHIPPSRGIFTLTEDSCEEFSDLAHVFASTPDLLPNILVSVVPLGSVVKNSFNKLADFSLLEFGRADGQHHASLRKHSKY